jgi:hypothetical protein
MDLKKYVDEEKMEVNYFFKNKFNEEKEMIKNWDERRMYNYLGCGVLEFIEDIIKFEKKKIEDE